ncbi:MAG TPA: hypothetical protein VFW31_10855 [Candidatus Angelobacter sp.]|jgi:hypothetical protein|nr:hypothetical protein [Candidatus Angelobacter sp.]
MKAIRAKECIYCRQSISRPPREHVIPFAFGSFERAPVLHCVCARCSHFFSSELERVFARRSGEGYARLYSGLRPDILKTPTTDVTGSDLPLIRQITNRGAQAFLEMRESKTLDFVSFSAILLASAGE